MMFSNIVNLAITGLVTASVGQAAPAARNNGKSSKGSSSTTYAECQRPKDVQGTQLQGCPNGTIYVSQTDPQSGFGSIQQAILSLPNDNSSQVILIGPGSYHEVVNVTRKGPVTLLGMTWNPSDWESNQVKLWSSSYINQTTQTASQDNADAVTLTVSPNRAASLVGAGPAGAPLQPEFGNVDFRVYNIDVANRATVNGKEFMGQTGPSAALIVAYANFSSFGSTYRSWQDSIFIGRNGSAFFNGGEIRGSTDYLYGFGTAWFEGVTMANRGNGGGITAWKGSSNIYGPDNFGVYQANGKIVRAPDAPATANLTLASPLGRPWNNASRSIYLNTEMSDIVLPQGFIAWSDKEPRIVPNLTFFGEYGSYGPGFNAAARNTSVETLLTKEQASQYTVEKVFGGMPAWIDLGTAVIKPVM
ncbi:hypothetical protein QFC21_002235 [Naganishia friedmannii]|uniref:Uncharacterized protein n=1 Tax=Naganishia friedmannii TaxID=89922 RepID=A0ACC2VX92_9TREE|nr:hypothetical protein QFC21_002235 [Naganishia friedmannii]